MEGNVKKKRDVSFDIAKGIAIFLVVWGHVLQQGIQNSIEGNYVVKIIYSVHMPLFAIISGRFFYISAKKRSFKELLIARVKSYIKLIVIWNSVHYILGTILNGREQISFITACKQWLEELLYGYWFLWAMFFYVVVSAFIIKKIKEQYWIIAFLVSIGIFMISPCRWVIISLFPFWIMGLVAEHKNAVDFIKKKKIAIVSLVLYGIGLMFYLTGDYISNAQVKTVLDVFVQMLYKDAKLIEIVYEMERLGLYYLLGLTGSICIINFSCLLANGPVNNTLGKVLAICGRETLAIYVIQRIIVEQLCWTVNIKLLYYLKREYLLWDIDGIVISFLMSCVFIFVIHWLIRGLKKFRVGKMLIDDK